MKDLSRRRERRSVGTADKILDFFLRRKRVLAKYTKEEKSKGDPRSSLVENAALKVVELEEEIASDILELVRVMKEIASAISRMDSMECRTILEMRYLSFMEWDEIISRMGYSRSYVFRLHKEALKAIGI